MRNRPTALIASVLAALVGASCNSFLDPKPTDVLTPDNFYKTSGDATTAINAVYAQMPFTYLYWWYVSDIGGDDLLADAGFGSDGHQLADYTLDKTLWTLDSEWSNLYITINRANIVIEHVPGIQMDTVARNRVVGQARFIRALSYFHLISLFGDVPLVLQEITDAKGSELPRTPVTQVRQQIISDLQLAMTELPATWAATPTDVGRATSGAATALLAKVYLYVGDWNNAAKYAGQVINAGTYHLQPSWHDIFKVAYQNTSNNVETIFSAEYGSPQIATGVTGSVQLLFGLPSGFPGGDAYGLEQVMPSFVHSFSATDTRANGGDFMISPYTDSMGRVSTWTSPGGAAPHKPLDESNTQNMTQRSWEQQANSLILLRYADVLLMYAEAVNEGGTPTAGTPAAALDLVRLRADPSATSTAALGQGAFRDTLRVERRKEFFNEGQRWFDLTRWGILKQTLTAKQAEIAALYPGEVTPHGAPSNLYPIPQTEINSDPKLTQNPGW